MGPSESDRLPTDEELRRVRRFECSQYGHTFVVATAEDHLTPRFVHCPHCGDKWPVLTPRSQRRASG